MPLPASGRPRWSLPRGSPASCSAAALSPCPSLPCGRPGTQVRGVCVVCVCVRNLPETSAAGTFDGAPGKKGEGKGDGAAALPAGKGRGAPPPCPCPSHKPGLVRAGCGTRLLARLILLILILLPRPKVPGLPPPLAARLRHQLGAPAAHPVSPRAPQSPPLSAARPRSPEGTPRGNTGGPGPRCLVGIEGP